MESLTKEQEQDILEALEQTVKLANDGMAPDEALLKVAEARQYGPELVQRMAEAFNTSKTRAHMKHASEGERGSSFPLMDAGAVIQKMYPSSVETESEKAAAALHFSYQQPCEITDFMKASGVALEFPSLTGEKPAPALTDPTVRADNAFSQRGQLKIAAEQARQAYLETSDELLRQVNHVADYYLRVGAKEAFATVQQRAFSAYGQVGESFMDTVNATLKGREKRAAAMPTRPMVFDRTRQPYCWVDVGVKTAFELRAAAKKTAAADRALNTFTFEHHDVFPSSWVRDAYTKLAAETPVGHRLEQIAVLLGLTGPEGPPTMTPPEAGPSPEESAGLTALLATPPEEEEEEEEPEELEAEAEKEARYRRRRRSKGHLTGIPATNGKGLSGMGGGSVGGGGKSAADSSSAPLSAVLGGDGNSPFSEKSAYGQAYGQGAAVQRGPVHGKVPHEDDEAIDTLPSLTAAKAREKKPNKDVEPAQPIKTAAIPGGVLTSFLGSTLAETVPKTDPVSAAQGAMMDVMDPQHEAELAKIRTRSMLNDFMTNDPVISTYGEDDVAGAFNQIAGLVPRSSREPAVMRGLLRKMLQQQDAMEPFEAEQLTKLEAGIQKRDTPEMPLTMALGPRT